LNYSVISAQHIHENILLKLLREAAFDKGRRIAILSGDGWCPFLLAGNRIIDGLHNRQQVFSQ
jgi:hypothetical protein